MFGQLKDPSVTYESKLGLEGEVFLLFFLMTSNKRQLAACLLSFPRGVWSSLLLDYGGV